MDCHYQDDRGPPQAAALIDPSDTLVLLLDHQLVLFQTVNDIPVADLRRNVEMIARLCALLEDSGDHDRLRRTAGTNGPFYAGAS